MCSTQLIVFAVTMEPLFDLMLLTNQCLCINDVHSSCVPKSMAATQVSRLALIACKSSNT